MCLWQPAQTAGEANEFGGGGGGRIVLRFRTAENSDAEWVDGVEASCGDEWRVKCMFSTTIIALLSDLIFCNVFSFDKY